MIEVEPGTFSRVERPLPDGSWAENPNGWDTYWRESLADSGIVDIAPVTPGTWLVPLSEFSASETLRTIMRHEFGELADWSIEELGPLSGGYVLTHGDVVIAPGCCGDLGNLAEWVQAAKCTHDSWQQVWIGHPWTHVRASGDTLSLAEPTEADEVDAKELLTLPRRALATAIDGADAERARFRTDLETVVTEFTPATSVDLIVDVLLKGHQ